MGVTSNEPIRLSAPIPCKYKPAVHPSGSQMWFTPEETDLLVGEVKACGIRDQLSIHSIHEVPQITEQYVNVISAKSDLWVRQSNITKVLEMFFYTHVHQLLCSPCPKLQKLWMVSVIVGVNFPKVKRPFAGSKFSLFGEWSETLHTSACVCMLQPVVDASFLSCVNAAGLLPVHAGYQPPPLCDSGGSIMLICV